MISKFEGWYTLEGPDCDVVLYTRCGIARNISGFLFPNAISFEDSRDVTALVFSFFNSFEESYYFKKLKLQGLDPLSVKLLEERGILLSDMPEKPEKGVIVHENGSLYVGVNLEDHINISSFTAGMDIRSVYAAASNLESKMQQNILFSADREMGFLTSHIMGIGSGLKFSALCSLPAIVYSDSINSLFECTKKHNLNLSGYYSPDSKNSIGALFLVSTSVCAGDDEDLQISNFISGINSIIQIERNLRKEVLNSNNLKIEDMLRRTLALSQSAKIMDFKEAADIVFKIKFGLNLGVIEGISHEACNAMVFKSQMGHLAFSLFNSSTVLTSKNLNDYSIEEYRAGIIQELCSNVKIIM